MRKVMPFAVLALGTLVALSSPAFAQEESATIPNSMAPKNVRGIIEDIRAKRTDIKAGAKDAKVDLRQKSSDLRQETKEKMQTATSSAERRAIEKNAIEARKGIITERRENVTDLKAERSALARQHLRAIMQRYEIAVRQFETLAGRIQARIDKIKSAGADASPAESALGAALSLIVQLKADVHALNDLRSQADSGADAKTLRAQVQTAATKANESVKSAHKALEKAVRALVSLARSQKNAVTPADPQ